MDGSKDGRMGGWAVGLCGVALFGAVAFLPIRPSAHPPADIHSEYVKYVSGKDTITAYLAYPERPQPAPGVIVIHEIFGQSDFIRQTTEQLAKDGFVAIAPDLLSRRGGTPASQDSARKLIAGLSPDTVTLDLDASVAYLRTVKAARRDRIGVIGFCWGGGQSFRYATNNPALGAFVVCYGPGPEAAAIARIRASGLGVYAENDARIAAGLAGGGGAGEEDAQGDTHTGYPRRGPGFLRSREKPEVADSAWRAGIQFFRQRLER